MVKIGALVEGQTEEEFVKSVLSPWLMQKGIYIFPTIVNTKIVKGGNNFKGGLPRWEKVKNDLHKLLGDKSIYVTTFFDFYGLPGTFPNKENVYPGLEPAEKARLIESGMHKSMANHPRFLPYIQVYEFEALLFADSKGFAEFFPEVEGEMLAIRDNFPSPEHINDNPLTAPSKRIQQHLPGYQKVTDGNLIALENGMGPLLATCSHFKEWIDRLTTLPPLT